MSTIMIRILRRNFITKFITKSHTSYLYSTSIIHRDNITETTHIKPTYQSVTEFYAGKSVFLTGATGFIGRVLIERLLFTCKDIENIYVLIREKKDVNVQQRLQELLQNPVFAKLKKTRPQMLRKIVPIAGDVGEARLGINPDDEQTLIEKVSVVIHAAADVRYRPPLSYLMQVNYEGTKTVLELGKKMKNLDVFVYVSTAYHNSNYVIDEFPLPSPRAIEDVYRVIENDDSRGIRKLLDKWGNRYLFSKNMSEAYVASNHGDMPTIIVRPSMVTSVYKDSAVGYNDSWVISTVLLADIASGLTHVVYGRKDVVVDIVPADYVANFLIVAAAKNARTTKCNVYNYGSGHCNPIDWKRLIKTYVKESKKHGYALMPFPSAYFTEVHWVVSVFTFLTQIVPAFTTDIWLRLTGRQPRYIKLQKNAISRRLLSEPATVWSWVIRSTRARELISTLNNEDKKTFPCDPVTINWDRYIASYCKGVKDYMLSYNKVKNK